MKHAERHALNRIAKKEKLKQIDRIHEYEREKQKEKLIEKSQLIDDFQKERSLILNEKRALNANAYEIRKSYMEKYENIIKKNNGIDVIIIILHIHILK